MRRFRRFVDCGGPIQASQKECEDDVLLLLLSCAVLDSPAADTLLRSSGPAHTAAAHQAQVTAQDSVWSAALDHLQRRGRQSVVLVSDSTATPPRLGFGDTTGLQAFDPLVSHLEHPLVSDFLARNTERAAVSPGRLAAADVRGPVAVLGRAERVEARIDPATGIYRFEKYPGATTVVRLSQVGFSPDRHRALVHLVFSCGPRCGNTQLMLLTRQPDGTWRVSRTAQGITF
jgi:hypothetical protein